MWLPLIFVKFIPLIPPMGFFLGMGWGLDRRGFSTYLCARLENVSLLEKQWHSCQHLYKPYHPTSVLLTSITVNSIFRKNWKDCTVQFGLDHLENWQAQAGHRRLRLCRPRAKLYINLRTPHAKDLTCIKPSEIRSLVHRGSSSAAQQDGHGHVRPVRGGSGRGHGRRDLHPEAVLPDGPDRGLF